MNRAELEAIRRAEQRAHYAAEDARANERFVGLPAKVDGARAGLILAALYLEDDVSRRYPKGVIKDALKAAAKELREKADERKIRVK